MVYDYNTNQILTSLEITDGASQRHIYAVNAGNIPIAISYKVDDTSVIAVVQNTAQSSTGRTDFIVSAQNAGSCIITFTRAASGNYTSATTKFKITSAITSNISSYTDTAGNEFTFVGNPIIDSTYAKFGTSVQVTPNNSLIFENFTIGDTDFTIEFWYYRTNNSCTFYFLNDTQSKSGNSTSALCNYHFISNFELWIPTNNSSFVKDRDYMYISENQLNTWHFSALVYQKSTGTWTNYLDGTASILKNNFVMPTTTFKYLIIGGKYREAVGAVYIDDFRISKVARYTGNTMTVPTTELTKDSNTLVLCHF